MLDAAMTGTDRPATADDGDRVVREFPPALDLLAPIVGAVGLIAAGLDSGGHHLLML